MANGGTGSGAIGKKRERMDKQCHLIIVAELTRKGYSSNQIAERLKVTPQTVTADKRLILRKQEKHLLDLVQEDANKRDKFVRTKRFQYRDILKECWEQWEASKEDARRKVTKRVTRNTVDGEEIKVEVTEEVIGRLPNAQFLKLATECLKAERELMGLDAPKKVENFNANLDLMKVLEQLPQDNELRDTVEEAIRNAMGMPPVETPLRIASEVMEPVQGDGVPPIPDTIGGNVAESTNPLPLTPE